MRGQRVCPALLLCCTAFTGTLRIPDPGCPALAQAHAGRGEPAQFSPATRNSFVEDPDGFQNRAVPGAAGD